MNKKNLIMAALVILIGGGAIAFSMRDIALSQFLRDLQMANWWWLLAAVFAMGIYIGVEAVVVQVLLPASHKIPWRDALRVPMMEQLGNGITPFATGGQPMQMLAMSQSGVPLGQSGSILLMKFIIFQTMIVVNFMIALVVGYHYVIEKLHALAILVLFGFLIHFVVVAMLLMVMFVPRLTEKLAATVILPIKPFVSDARFTRWNQNIQDKLQEFYQESRRMVQTPKTIVLSGLLTIFQLGVYYAIPYMIIRSLGYNDVNLMMIIALHIMIVLVISLFPIPGGAGGAELSFQSLFAGFITQDVKLVLAMLLWRFLTYYLGMMLGIIAYFIRPQVKKEKW